MSQESLSNSTFGDLQKERKWKDRLSQRGHHLLWSFLERQYPQFFQPRSTEKSLENQNRQSRTFFFPYKNTYNLIRHFPARGRFRGGVLCLPPLGYTSDYFDFCFSSLSDMSRCGFDVFFINYPQNEQNFEDISDDYLGQLLLYLQKIGHIQIRIWCSVGIGGVFLERNASLGHRIDLAIMINTPQYPVPLDRIHSRQKLRLPASIRHAYLLFENFEDRDLSSVRSERTWLGINKYLQRQWTDWLEMDGFVYKNKKNIDEIVYFTNPHHQNISRLMLFYTKNHPFLQPDKIEERYKGTQPLTILPKYQLPNNFLDLLLSLLK
jgi:hypothetical protein